MFLHVVVASLDLIRCRYTTPPPHGPLHRHEYTRRFVVVCNRKTRLPFTSPVILSCNLIFLIILRKPGFLVLDADISMPQTLGSNHKHTLNFTQATAMRVIVLGERKECACSLKTFSKVDERMNDLSRENNVTSKRS